MLQRASFALPLNSIASPLLVWYLSFSAINFKSVENDTFTFALFTLQIPSNIPFSLFFSSVVNVFLIPSFIEISGSSPTMINSSISSNSASFWPNSKFILYISSLAALRSPITAIFLPLCFLSNSDKVFTARRVDSGEAL